MALPAQRQALAARAGIGRKNPKGENAKGADSLKAETHPAFVRLHAMLGCFWPTTNYGFFKFHILTRLPPVAI